MRLMVLGTVWLLSGGCRPRSPEHVLMHLLALGALCPAGTPLGGGAVDYVLMHRLVLILQGCRKMSHAIWLSVLQVLKSER